MPELERTQWFYNALTVASYNPDDKLYKIGRGCDGYLILIYPPSDDEYAALVKNQVLFDSKRLLYLLDSAYDFRKGLFSRLSSVDLRSLSTALGIQLTPREKERYINPAKMITDYFPIVENFFQLGWGVTIMGNDMPRVMDRLVDPYNKSNIYAPHSTRCFIVFTQPRKPKDEEPVEYSKMSLSLYRRVHSDLSWPDLKIDVTIGLDEPSLGWPFPYGGLPFLNLHCAPPDAGGPNYTWYNEKIVWGSRKESAH